MRQDWPAPAAALPEAAADSPAPAGPALPDAAALRERALRLLARRDYPRAELERKLIAFCASQARSAAALELVNLPDMMRGFGHVKEANVAKAKQREAELLAALKSAPPQARAAAE